MDYVTNGNKERFTVGTEVVEVKHGNPFVFRRRGEYAIRRVVRVTKTTFELDS